MTMSNSSIQILKYAFGKTAGLINSYEKKMSEFHKEVSKLDVKTQMIVYASLYLRRF